MTSVQVGDEVRITKAHDPYQGKVGRVYARWEGLSGSVWVKVIFDDLAKGLYESTALDVKSYDHMIEIADEMSYR